LAAPPDLNVQVKDDEIIVTQSGSDFVEIQRAEHEPELIAKGKLYGPLSFAASRAFDKTRALASSAGSPEIVLTRSISLAPR
jgi:hypothetical protein